MHTTAVLTLAHAVRAVTGEVASCMTGALRAWMKKDGVFMPIQ